MHAYLLITDKDTAQLSLKLILKEPYSSELFYEVKKIEEVRVLKKTFLFPPKEQTLIVVTGVDEAKVEAQNALLKLLEEPPSETLIFLLIAKQKSALIPTVLSRLSLIYDEPSIKTETKAQIPLSTGLFQSFSKITDREEALSIMKQLSERSDLSVAQKEAALNALSALKKNGSIQLHLTNFLLNAVDLP